MWPVVGIDKHSYLTEDGVSVGERTARKWKDGWKVGWMDESKEDTFLVIQ